MPFETVVARNDQRLALVYKSTFIVGTLLTGVWLWLFFRRDYSYLAQHMVVALHFSCRKARPLSLCWGRSACS